MGLAALALTLGALAEMRPQEAPESYGVSLFPGAQPLPAMAQAIAAYYRPALSDSAGLDVGAFETPADFEAVYRFYGPRMDPGKGGWRRKAYGIVHQTKTLEFLRARLLAERADGGTLPAVFAPLFGATELSQDAFAARLATLAERHRKAIIEVAEGTRRIQGSPDNSYVRIVVERPYLDLAAMRLVDKTRIQLIKTSDGTGH